MEERESTFRPGTRASDEMRMSAAPRLRSSAPLASSRGRTATTAVVSFAAGAGLFRPATKAATATATAAAVARPRRTLRRRESRTAGAAATVVSPIAIARKSDRSSAAVA